MNEGKKICKLIKTNQEQNDPNANVLIATLDWQKDGAWDLLSCAQYIMQNQPRTAVMLLMASSAQRLLYVAIVMPSLDLPGPHSVSLELRNNLLYGNWMDESIETIRRVQGLSIKLSELDSFITMKELSFIGCESKEYDPEKLIDQVRANAFSYLRSHGLYVDPPEEKEYTFDDLEDM